MAAISAALAKLQTVKPSRDDAFDVLKTQLNAIKCPPWLAARLNRTKEE